MDVEAGEESERYFSTHKKKRISFLLVSPFKRQKLFLQQKYLPLQSPPRSSVNQAEKSSTDALGWSESEGEISDDDANSAQPHTERVHPQCHWHDQGSRDRAEPRTETIDVQQETPTLTSGSNGQHTQDNFLSSVIKQSYQKMKDCQSFQSSTFWSKLYEAAQQKPADPRFTPKLLHATRDSLKVSTVINLYATGFSFDGQEQAYAYARNTTSITDAINLGTLPGQVDHLLVRALSDQVHNKPGQITFYEGGVIVEIRDYREGRAIHDEATQTLQPHNFRIYLRPELHNLIQYLDLQKAHPSIRAIVEQSLTLAIHPHLCLDPSPTVYRITSAINYRIQKFNVPFKYYRQRRSLLVPARESHLLPRVRANSQNDRFGSERSSAGGLTYFLPISTTTISGGGAVAQAIKPRGNELTSSPVWETVELSDGEPRVCRHLMQISYQQRPDLEQDVPVHPYSEKKRLKSDVPSNASICEPVGQYPPVTGRWLFAIPRCTSQNHPVEGHAPSQVEWVTLKILLNSQSLGEYHASLRVGNSKPLSFQIGSSAAALTFIEQFKRIEALASPEQTKGLSVRNLPVASPQATAAAANKPQQQQGNGNGARNAPSSEPPSRPAVGRHPSGPLSLATADYKPGQGGCPTRPDQARSGGGANFLRPSSSSTAISPADMNYVSSLIRPSSSDNTTRKYGSSPGGPYASAGMTMPREILPPMMFKQQPSMLHGHVLVPGGNAKYAHPTNILTKQANSPPPSSSNYGTPLPSNRHYIPPDTQRVRTTMPTFKISPGGIVPKIPGIVLPSPNESSKRMQKKP